MFDLIKTFCTQQGVYICKQTSVILVMQSQEFWGENCHFCNLIKFIKLIKAKYVINIYEFKIMYHLLYPDYD